MTPPQSLHLCAANPSHQHHAPATIPSYRSEPPGCASLPSTGTLAPINGVSANSGARALSAVPLPARPAQCRARCWLARAATAIRGFPDGASGPPDALCIRGRRAEPTGTFDAYIHPFAHNDDLPLSFSLNMDDDAPSVMGSPELEDRYTFVIESTCRAAASDLEMASVGVRKLRVTSAHRRLAT